jgi:signal transduction histidine kinase
MVSVANSPLTHTGFRRDVRLFLTCLAGFLIAINFALLIFLRTNLARSEAAIDRTRQMTADLAADAVNRGAGSSLDTLLGFLRGRFDVAGLEIDTRDGRRIVSGAHSGELDEVTRLAGPGTLRLRFDAAPRRIARRNFLLTAIISIAATTLAGVLLLLYVPRITGELKRLHDLEKTRADELERVSAALTRSLTSGLIAIDANGAIVDVNHAGREILRIPHDAALAGRALEDSVPLPAFAATLRRAVDERAALTRVEIQDHETTIGLTTVPLRNESDEFLGFLALFTDLTPIRSLEARVQEMTTLAQLGEISAGIAHEFRSSLSTILGYMKLARRGGVDEVAEGRLQSAEKEAALLLQAIERLLAFARPVELNAEAVDLKELVSEQAAQLADHAPDVPFRVDGPPVVIDGDRVLLARAFENLLRNALDAVRQKGSGSVAVTLSAAPPTVTIADDGVGLDPADTARLFLPFQSNKPNGFGMGLPLAKKIVLVHGGTLRLQGEPGKGAVATVQFEGREDAKRRDDGTTG